MVIFNIITTGDSIAARARKVERINAKLCLFLRWHCDPDLQKMRNLLKYDLEVRH